MHFKRLEIVRLSPSLFCLTAKYIQGTTHNFPPFPPNTIPVRVSVGLQGG